VVDASGVAMRIEVCLPIGVRRRQLSVHSLLLGMLLVQADGRPAHLSRVHAALSSLPEDDRLRLGVAVTWRSGRHELTYRQVEYTMSLVCSALSRQVPDGTPSQLLQQVVDALVEASIPQQWKSASGSYAVDWSDLETFSLPPSTKGGRCADMEASWGHRRGKGPGQKDELFFGYYFQLATMVNEESGAALPELVRRLLVTSCLIDPPPAFVGVLAAMVAEGAVLRDVLADSGYSHRRAEHWALPLRAMGASLVQDLHPSDRGTQGTHAGAVLFNGNLYCPATPKALFEIEPLSRQASEHEVVRHDETAAELARYKLGRVSRDDSDGYHRVACPAVLGKLRCPLRERSMALSYTRPAVFAPPEHPPACCRQQTVTVPAEVNAKTRQKHDYPSPAHRKSYARRTAVERSNSTAKDRATTDVSRGWCRLMGLTAVSVFLACLFVVRNERVLDAFAARQEEDERRRLLGLPPRTRRRRRTIDNLVATAHSPP